MCFLFIKLACPIIALGLSNFAHTAMPKCLNFLAPWLSIATHPDISSLFCNLWDVARARIPYSIYFFFLFCGSAIRAGVCKIARDFTKLRFSKSFALSYIYCIFDSGNDFSFISKRSGIDGDVSYRILSPTSCDFPSFPLPMSLRNSVEGNRR